MNSLSQLHSLHWAFLLFSIILITNSCEKPAPPPEEPFSLTDNIQGDWFADLVTQAGVDITASQNYAFTFDPLKDSTCIVQRVWAGATTQFVCTYKIDEDLDKLFINYNGSNVKWELQWKLMEADTVHRMLRFKDERASTDTYINLLPY
jgi:hypothetical protein